MKMRYSRRPRSLIAIFSIPTLVVGVLIALIVLMRFVFPGALQAIAQPLWLMGSVGARALTVEDTQTLTQQRDALRAQVDALLAEKLALELAVQDITRLAEEGERLAVRVLARPPVTPYDVLTISGGTKDGVQVGQSVYGPGGTPLGTVSGVSNSRAQVLLYSSALRESQALVGDADVPVTLIGRGGGALYASVATDAPVAENDMVTVAGLPVGIVHAVEKNPASPEAVLIIRPSVNPFTLSWVQVATELP